MVNDMKTTKPIVLLLSLISIMLSTLAFAQSNYELGTVLTPSQISALGNMRSFSVAGATFRVLPAASVAGGNVINEQGKIGKCEGDVLISGISTDQAKNALAPYQASIVSTKVYDSLKMVSARFSNLVDAANARNSLANSLPDARVTLPVVFSLPKKQ
jgi:hypothetical protein